MASSTRTCPRCGGIVVGSRDDALCQVCLLESALGDSLVTQGETSANLASWTTGLRLPEPPAQLRYFGDYELVGELARGGMGVVYLARQISLDRLVAVKLLLFGEFSSTSFVERFRSEASAAARLQHPGIVGIYEIGEHEGQQFFSMEYVPGENLAQRVIRQPPTPREAAALLADVAGAVHFAHSRGILHRDLKPANVLVDSAGRARVTDFGLAKRMDRNLDITVTGEVLGSPCFMAPEQIRGDSSRVGVTADVYGLGAMLYHALTGRPPLQASTVPATLDLVLREEPLSPRSLNPSVPRDLETICLKCLAKAPAQRYLEASSLQADLQRFLNDEPISARPAGAPERLWRWSRRRPALAGFVLVAVLLVLTLAGGGILYGRQQRLGRQRESALRGESDRQRYAMSINLAERARSEGDFSQADKLLASVVPRAGDIDLRGWEWYHLKHELRGQEDRVLWEGTNEIHGLVSSPNGDRLATLFPQELRILNVSDGATLAQWPLPEDGNNRSAIFTPDGSAVVVGAISGATIYRPGDPPRVILTEPANVLTFSEDGSRLAYSSVDIEASMDAPVGLGVLHVPSKRVLYRTETNGGPGLAWIHSSNGDDTELLVLGSRGALTRWRFRDERAEFETVWSRVHFTDAASFSPDRKQVLFDDVRGYFDWYAIPSDPQLHKAPPPRLRIPWSVTRPAFGFIADGSVIALKNGADRRIALCDAKSGSVIGRYPGHRGDLSGLTFLGNSRILASGSRDGTIRLWNIDRPRESFRITNDFARLLLPKPVFSKDSKLLALQTRYTGREDTFSIIRLPDFSLKTVTNGVPIGFVEDSNNVLLWKPTGELSLYHESSNQFLNLPGGPWSKNWGTMTSDGRFLIVREPGEIRVALDLRNNATRTIIATNTSALTSAPTKPLVAMMTALGVCLWDPDTRTNSVLIAREAAELAFSANSRFLGVGEVGGTLTVIEIATAKVAAEFSGHTGSITAIAFSPDGRTVVSGGDDRTLRFWSMLTGTPLMIKPMPENVHWLSFSPDGKWLVIGWVGAFELIEAPGASMGPSPSNPMPYAKPI